MALRSKNKHPQPQFPDALTWPVWEEWLTGEVDKEKRQVGAVKRIGRTAVTGAASIILTGSKARHNIDNKISKSREKHHARLIKKLDWKPELVSQADAQPTRLRRLGARAVESFSANTRYERALRREQALRSKNQDQVYEPKGAAKWADEHRQTIRRKRSEKLREREELFRIERAKAFRRNLAVAAHQREEEELAADEREATIDRFGELVDERRAVVDHEQTKAATKRHQLAREQAAQTANQESMTKTTWTLTDAILDRLQKDDIEPDTDKILSADALGPYVEWRQRRSNENSHVGRIGAKRQNRYADRNSISGW